MYQRILAPIDGSETSLRALKAAIQIARENDAELVPLYVIDIPLLSYDAPDVDPPIALEAFRKEGERLKADALAAMQRENVKGMPRIVEVVVPGSDIAHSILEEAHAIQADLVVMGTHGRRGFKRFVLGGVTERFMRMARCHVLLVPASFERTGTAQPEKESS
jgi:nucleotide-binding universal stress UspA family protein